MFNFGGKIDQRSKELCVSLKRILGCGEVWVSEREEDGDQFGYFFFGDEFCLLINGDDGSLPNMHVQFVMIVLEILSDLTDFDTK